MPFGDNTKTYLANISRDQFYESSGRDMHGSAIAVEHGQPPDWWSEYLLHEWKRRHRFEQQPRDYRTRWKRADDEWRAQLRMSASVSFRKEPLHTVWGDSD